MKKNMFVRQMLKIGILALILAVLCVAELAAPAQAQQYTSVRPGGRAGTWDFQLPLTYSNSTTINGQNGTNVFLDDAWGLGIGFGYNFTDRFELGGLWSWNSRSYTATTQGLGGGRNYTNWMNTSALTVNGTFYFLDGNITPFVTGGVGFVYIDTNIPTGYSGGSTCWWDPWWGYVCDSYTPTYTENDWTYNAGVGLRADVNRQFALQLGYYKTWIEMNNGTTPDFNIWKFDLVFRMQ
jgi:opacity protein-like surface antigen